MNRTRYFIRSRHLAGKVAGGRVNIGFREMDAAEAEPHIAARERREEREREEQWQLERQEDEARYFERLRREQP